MFFFAFTERSEPWFTNLLYKLLISTMIIKLYYLKKTLPLASPLFKMPSKLNNLIENHFIPCHLRHELRVKISNRISSLSTILLFMRLCRFNYPAGGGVYGATG